MSFNLEKFKAGVPAISRCGEEWTYAGDVLDMCYPISANSAGGFSTFTVRGTVFVCGKHDSDLISMKDEIDDITSGHIGESLPASTEQADYKKREREFVEKCLATGAGPLDNINSAIKHCKEIFAKIEEHYK